MKKKIIAVLSCILVLCTIGSACAAKCNHAAGITNRKLVHSATCSGGAHPKGNVYTGKCVKCGKTGVIWSDGQVQPHSYTRYTGCGNPMMCSYSGCHSAGANAEHKIMGATCSTYEHCTRSGCNYVNRGKGIDPNAHKNVDMTTGKCRDCGRQAFNPYGGN